MRGIEGKVVIVTGGSSGIGQAIAIRLAEDGANVAINYVGYPDGAESTRDAIERGKDACMCAMRDADVHPMLVAADVSQEDQVEQMFKDVLAEYGHVDFLVNNAGIQLAADTHELPVDSFDRVLAVNLRGAFLCARQALRHMVDEERPGAIVNVSSVHQEIPKPRFLPYSVSKGGMQNLTRTLALEYAGRGIRVNAIAPGATITPINRSWVDDPEKRAMVESHIPMARAGESWEMAAVASFLLSDEAAYITGQTLFIDGGLTLFRGLPDHVVVGMTALPTFAVTETDVWWPSRYGADDQAGALNEIGPDSVVGAARLVRQGQVYDLAHVLHMDVPAFEGRTFCQELDVPQSVPGAHGLGFVIERVHAPSQMGTHLDGLNHLHKDGRTYNGHRIVDVAAPHGTTKLGADTLPQVVTRGVLVDVAARRGVARLDAGDVITPDDVTGVEVRRGDAVLFHTGWGRLWYEDPARYGSGEPGPGMALAEWLTDHRVALTGCDTWSYGPVPAEDPDQPFVVPQMLNTRHGVVVVENLFLSDLARDAVGEFLLVIAHPKLSGATGAWVAPLAIV